MSVLNELTIQVLIHGETGLRMALCDALPGFIVHANTSEELDEKIPTALQSFIKRTKGEDTLWVLMSEETPPGFLPNHYIARQRSHAEAA